VARRCGEQEDAVHAMAATRTRSSRAPSRQALAREIAKQVEHDLTYPGQVTVTVCRETRTTEIAR